LKPVWNFSFAGFGQFSEIY